MKKLLEIDIIKAVGSILLAPIVFIFLVAIVFRPWVVNNLLFGSTDAAITLSIVLAFVPLIVTIWHSVIQIRSLIHNLDN